MREGAASTIAAAPSCEGVGVGEGEGVGVGVGVGVVVVGAGVGVAGSPRRAARTAAAGRAGAA